MNFPRILKSRDQPLHEVRLTSPTSHSRRMLQVWLHSLCGVLDRILRNFFLRKMVLIIGSAEKHAALDGVSRTQDSLPVADVKSDASSSKTRVTPDKTVKSEGKFSKQVDSDEVSLWNSMKVWFIRFAWGVVFVCFSEALIGWLAKLCGITWLYVRLIDRSIDCLIGCSCVVFLRLLQQWFRARRPPCRL